MATIAGIDYSLNCPAICVYTDSRNSFAFENCDFYFCQNNASNRRKKLNEELRFKNINISYQTEHASLTERYFSLALWGWNVIEKRKPDVVVMESYSMGSKGRIFELAEATGYMKLGIFVYHIPLILFAPSSIKKEFSGKGNADKAVMAEAFREKEGFYLHEEMKESNPKNSPCSDLIDSFAIVYKFLKTTERGEKECTLIY